LRDCPSTSRGPLAPANRCSSGSRAIEHRSRGEAQQRRNRELLAALARGLNNKAQANELGISVNTVKFHLRNLYEKLSLTSRAQTIAFYHLSGAAKDKI
jgi:two-component system nitrate/nitrite response regulator NarP